MHDRRVMQADVIVVGSGPGGATLARDLARSGRRVLLLERGRDYRHHPDYGTYLGALRYADRMSFLFTREGMNVIRPLMVGGATSMYCGCAASPPSWLKTRYKIDLDREVAATMDELQIAALPADLCGPASTRIATAGQALGYAWQPQLKFMRPAASPRFDCGAKCMLGCRCGAKWNAGSFVDEALLAGAELRTRAQVVKVLHEGGRVIGVAGRWQAAPFVAYANTVVLAAGGIGTPRILQDSGFRHAGTGITMDTTAMVYGVTKERGIGHEPPMSWSWHNAEAGYMLSTLIDPWLLYPLITALKGWAYPLTWPRWSHTLGVMIKLKDDLAGGVRADGSISKPLSKNDRERLESARYVAARILREAGATAASIFMTPLRGTHPSSTVRIGMLLDGDLQTEIRGLYVCDASAFPEALGQPTVLTIIGLAKRLARYLVECR